MQRGETVETLNMRVAQAPLGSLLGASAFAAVITLATGFAISVAYGWVAWMIAFGLAALAFARWITAGRDSAHDRSLMDAADAAYTELTEKVLESFTHRVPVPENSEARLVAYLGLREVRERALRDTRHASGYARRVAEVGNMWR